MSTAESTDKSKSLLRNFLSCVACSQPMKIERGDPDAEGRVVVQYRCRSCGHIELIGFRAKAIAFAASSAFKLLPE
jgi:hypothetical protein